MKKLLIFMGLLFPLFTFAQKTDYKVVFDLTSKDTSDHRSIIRWLNGITKSTPDAKLEVVMYSKGLEMVLKDKSVVADDISKLVANKNISFVVCEAAMKNQNIDKSQLLPNVTTVPDGIYEILMKQRQGWGYIKAAR
ncbi:DsrE family protein [Solitalea lacus]|uniref:DsrE family protein n=1 Tax=Solitalea lacus TaxID=2911172 RepID=UPI001EDA0646|nr:DsrE family protein [Solitalea lacus]UKJ07987.1 DsrE family protein [Solitalea lacus]